MLQIIAHGDLSKSYLGLPDTLFKQRVSVHPVLNPPGWKCIAMIGDDRCPYARWLHPTTDAS